MHLQFKILVNPETVKIYVVAVASNADKLLVQERAQIWWPSVKEAPNDQTVTAPNNECRDTWSGILFFIQFTPLTREV